MIQKKPKENADFSLKLSLLQIALLGRHPFPANSPTLITTSPLYAPLLVQSLTHEFFISLPWNLVSELIFLPCIIPSICAHEMLF